MLLCRYYYFGYFRRSWAFGQLANIFHFLELTDFDWHLIVYMQCVLTQPFRTRIGF